jgi:hypothetical protein
LNSHLKIFAVVCAMALLIPAGATAKRPEGKPERGKPEHSNAEHGKPDKGKPDATDTEEGTVEEGDAKGDKPSKADKPKKAKSPKVKLASANIKGVVDSNDGSTMTVTVNKASGHVRGCKGAALTFDVSSARIHTADNDADLDADAADVLVGHAVKVRFKVARVKGKKTGCAVLEGETLVAKAVHNRTTPPVEDEAEETDDVVDEPVVEDEPELEEGDEELGEDEVVEEEVVDTV